MASATPRASFSSSAWFAHLSMCSSVCGSYSQSRSRTSSQPGHIEALSEPKTPSTGWVPIGAEHQAVDAECLAGAAQGDPLSVVASEEPLLQRGQFDLEDGVGIGHHLLVRPRDHPFEPTSAILPNH